jgi:hypothetical protein
MPHCYTPGWDKGNKPLEQAASWAHINMNETPVLAVFPGGSVAGFVMNSFRGKGGLAAPSSHKKAGGQVLPDYAQQAEAGERGGDDGC